MEPSPPVPDAGRAGRIPLWLTSLFSLVAALGLLLLLIHFADVDWNKTLAHLKSVDSIDLTILLILALIQTWLGSEKWRLVQTLRGEQPGRTAAFSISAVGVGLGQLLPAQIAAGAARAFGIKWLHAKSALRGGLTSLYEQSFDVVIVGCLAGSTAMAMIFRDSGLLWSLCAFTGLLIGFLVALWFAREIERRFSAAPTRLWPAGLRKLAPLVEGGYVAPPLVGRLFLLSVLRFATVALSCIVMSHALSFDIPAWKIVAALPIPLIAIALTVAPGGIGVNELAMASALALLGVQPDVAVEWSLASRALSAAVYLTIGAIGGLALLPMLARRASSPPS